MTEGTNKTVKAPAAGKKGSRKEAGTRSHLTPKQKAEAIALWQAGEVTYEQLVARYGKSKSTFQALFRKAGVKHGEKAGQVAQQVQQQVQQAINEDATVLAQRIKETKEEHYKLSTAIAKLVGRIIMQAAQNNTPLAAHQNDFKALQAASLALKTAREERFAVLGILDGEKGDDDRLPELEVRELTQDQILEMARARGDEDDLDKGLLELDEELKKAEAEGDDDGIS